MIIGGGDCGTLREVLKHPGVESAVQCDIDEQVTRMAEKWFPELCDANDDPRATLMFDDGIAYMKNAEPGSLDVVIVDSTDPVGPAEGLFNKAFYESCFRALKDDGILVQQSESPLVLLELIKEMRARDGQGRLHRPSRPCRSRSRATRPAGGAARWRARASGFEFREADARAKAFDTRYYNADIHQGAAELPPFVAAALGE